MRFSLQLLVCVSCLSLGQCFDNVALLQNVEIRGHVDDAPKEKHSVLREMLKNSQMPPGLADSIPENMPEIDMGEAFSLIDLLPVLIKGVSDELPKVVRTARTLAYMSERRARTLEAGDNCSEAVLKERITTFVANYKDAWLPFATALVDGLNNAIVPVIREAQTRVSFIPANATDVVLTTVTNLINHTAMSGLAQIPVQRDLHKINERAFDFWNKTNTTLSFLKGLLIQDGGALDSLSMLPTPGVNLTNVVLELKPQVVQCVDSVESANNAVAFAIHHVSERMGVDWRAQPESDATQSGSVGVRASLALLLASSFTLFRL